MAQLFAKLAVAFGTQADKKDGEPLLEAARVHSNESTQFPFGKAWLGMVGHRTAPGRARMNAKSGIMKAGHWPGLDILKCIRDQNPTSVSPIFSQVLILIRKYLLHIMMCAFVHRLHCFVAHFAHLPIGPPFQLRMGPCVQRCPESRAHNVIQRDPARSNSAWAGGSMAAKPAAEGRSGVWPSDKRAPAGPRGREKETKQLRQRN